MNDGIFNRYIDQKHLNCCCTNCSGIFEQGKITAETTSQMVEERAPAVTLAPCSPVIWLGFRILKIIISQWTWGYTTLPRRHSPRQLLSDDVISIKQPQQSIYKLSDSQLISKFHMESLAPVVGWRMSTHSGFRFRKTMEKSFRSQKVIKVKFSLASAVRAVATHSFVALWKRQRSFFSSSITKFYFRIAYMK